MDYCDECGGIIVPEKKGDDTSFKCRSCGKEYEEEGEELVIREENEDEKKHINVGGEDENRPITDEECEECGNEKAYWWTEQTRSADEPPTRFYRCTECSHTWRVYD
ncbi:MAG: transcription factor S [Candidatus Nanohaloarchaeota archaeon QJJ-7]|nr:transcription factor S [Candidatus Nanohaloarchaeota archaeon QJJ-7]